MLISNDIKVCFRLFKRNIQSNNMYKILMVDDSAQMSELFGEMLKKESILIDYAPDGHKGVLMSRGIHYDMIIMDLNMPKVNGIDATVKIRNTESKKNYICAFTTYMDFKGLHDNNLFDIIFSKADIRELINHIKYRKSYYH